MDTKSIITGICFVLGVAASQTIHAQTGVYTLNGGSAEQTGQTYTATQTDQSAVYVLNSGILQLTSCILDKTGNSSDVNESSEYGLNAGILVESAGSVTMNNCSVTTNASGANGLFATGTNSAITMTNGFIDATGTGAHGVDVTYGGAITITNVDVTTDGANSSAIATDFGGGTVTVNGSTVISADTASGSHSAGIYSTGVITVNDLNSAGGNTGFDIYPNPIGDKVTISFNLSEGADIEISLVDLSGRTIGQISRRQLSPGGNVLELNVSSELQTGIYLILFRVTDSNEIMVMTKKVIKN